MGVTPKAGQYDCVIIGAGAGGGATAWRLCQHGLRVLLLEAGPRFDPDADYKLAEPDWERHPFPVKPNSQGQFTFGNMGTLTEQHKDLRSWSLGTGPYSHGNVREVAGTGYSHVQGVGGSTLHFTGEAHRLHPDAMQMHSHFGVAADWPLTYAQLEPYYALSEQQVGVAGSNKADVRWRSVDYPLPAHPLSPPAQRLQAAGEKLGMYWQANARAALSEPYDDRPACNYCGNCNRGCPIGDKGSTDVTFIRKAEATDLLTIKTNCQVTKLIAGKNGKITSATYIENGVRQQIETPRLILAAGAVQTPRLLLASGIANSSGQVGRNFMETLYWSSTGLVEGLTNSHMGLPADAICWDHNAPDAIDGIIGGCRFTSSTQEVGYTGPIAYATRAVEGFGLNLKRNVRKSFGHALTVGAIGEVLPNEHSFVDLDPTRKDATGLPLARIHAQLGEMEIKRLHFMAKTARALLEQAGADPLVEEISTYDQFQATHVFGTCRMGNNAKTSVVDASGRAHDHDNLFIADASVFPSSGGGEAPSLTIHALAIRAADAVVGATLLPASEKPKA